MLDPDQPWDTQPIVVVDTETTGVTDSDAVCEIAAVRFEGGQEVASFSSLVNPGVPISAGASAVNGITDADVANAPTLPELAADLFAIGKGAAPCAYNAPFDRTMIHRQLQRLNCPALDPGWGWIDVYMIIASPRVDKFVSGPGRLKLTAACARWGIAVEGAPCTWGCAGHGPAAAPAAGARQDQVLRTRAAAPAHRTHAPGT